jgi:hypothetical protein
MDNEDLEGVRKARAEDPYVVVPRCPVHGHIFRREGRDARVLLPGNRGHGYDEPEPPEE